MRRLFLLIILAPLLVVAQQTITGENILTINNFGGLNTRSGDFSIKSNQFRELLNFDLDRNVGSLTKRFGYDSIGTIVGQDSILGIYGAYYTDGSQQLIIVTDSAGVDYGNIYVTQPNSNIIDKDGVFTDIADSTGDSLMRIATLWPVFNKPIFTMFEDKVYIVNGSSKGIVFDREAAYIFPPNAPGEPTIIPLKRSTGNTLTGEYRYLFRWSTTLGTDRERKGFATYPIRVNTGHIRLSDFQWMTVDTSSAVNDSVVVYVYRTKANPGNINESDSAYWTGRTIKGSSISDIAGKIFVDSVQDEALSDTVEPLEDFFFRGRRSTGVVDGDVRYGAPTYISGGLGDTGIYFGTDAVDTIVGMVYAATFLDTATKIESPLGPRAMIVRRGTNDSTYLMGLPRISNNLSGQLVNLYRAPIIQLGFDTSVILDSVWRTAELEQTGELYWYIEESWRTIITPGDSTLIGDYHLIYQATSGAGDTTFQDTINFDSAYYLPLYRPTLIRTPSSYIFSAYDQLYSIRDNTMSFTSIDSNVIWFPTDAIVINADDGDRIVAAYAARGVIRVFKTKSMYNLFQNANGVWNKQEVTNYIGIVAPLSLSTGVNGVFYLTDNGVFREEEGIHKDRFFDVGLISGDIAELDTIPIVNKIDAVGFQYRSLFVLSLPSGGFSGTTGNTFVRFNKTSGWGTWDLLFGGTTPYSTETELSFVPGDTLYFFKPGGDDILRFGVSEQDNGAVIPVRALSAPLLTQDMSLFKRINRIGLTIEATVHDTLTVQITDEEKNTVSPDIKFLDTRTKYQISSADNGTTIGRYFQYRLTNQSGDWAANTRIEAIELFWNIEGQSDDN